MEGSFVLVIFIRSDPGIRAAHLTEEVNPGYSNVAVG